MKRVLTLKIGGLAADLDTAALVLFNYTAERMDSPASVKNSYSQQVTLPGTPGNGAIFGKFWRADRRTVSVPGRHTGVNFDAMRRTPFQILAGGEIIESGYCKLDSVTRRGDLVTGYAVTLYGGLGSFYYALAYKDGDGDGKKTLADLAYLTGAADELDFRINAGAVAEAWARLQAGEDATPSKWDIINFAPTYGGLPEGTFDASKALFKPGAVGLATEVDGKTTAPGGWALCDLGADRTEWEVKDLRSYMQRPVLSVKKLIAACCDPANNGGHTVVLDPAFFNDDNPYYAKAWMTLPRLDSLTLEPEHAEGALALVGPSIVAEMTPATGAVTVDIENATFAAGGSVNLAAALAASVNGAPLYFTTQYTASGQDIWLRHGVFVQLIALDSDDNILAVSKAALFQSPRYNGQTLDPEIFAEYAGYTPLTVPGGEAPGFTAGSVGYFDTAGTAATWNGPAQDLTLEGGLMGADAVTFKLIATPVKADVNTTTAVWMHLYLSQSGGAEGADLASVTAAPSAGSLTTDTYSEVHTGAHITKQTLLSTDATPADYLFSYSKIFGLKFLYEKATGVVRILTKVSFYTGDTLDIDDRVDRAQDVQTVPHAVAAKWYDFGLETSGQYAELYQRLKGRVFGSQRVNTGYEFDTAIVDVLGGNVFKGAAEVLELNKLFCNPEWTRDGRTYPMPAAFLAGGCQYKLFDADGDTELPTGSAASSIAYLNDFKGYDADPKVQLHDGDGKALDGANILLFFRGMLDSDGQPEGDEPEPWHIDIGDKVFSVNTEAAASQDVFVGLPGDRLLEFNADVNATAILSTLADDLLFAADYDDNGTPTHVRHGLMLQLVVRDQNDIVLATSDAQVLMSTDDITARDFAAHGNYYPVTVGGYWPGFSQRVGGFLGAGTQSAFDTPGHLTARCQTAADAYYHVEIIATPVWCDWTGNGTPVYGKAATWKKLYLEGQGDAGQDFDAMRVRVTNFTVDVTYSPAPFVGTARFALTDDTPAMAALNEGTPCWLLEQGDGTLVLPSFGRYRFNNGNVADSWDFGRPLEVDIPGVVYGAGTEIYARFWAAFIADRYDRDARVVTAWIDWRGVPVDEALLRRFFRFDGALWALNKVIDYDMTGGGLTKCEFVKVTDPAAYSTNA